MSFQGFGPQALPFFKALAFHQTKEWFEENRGTYETAVKAPMGDLVEAMAARLAKTKNPVTGDRKSSVFRIHRDLRFSSNKDPYKTNAGVAMTRSGSKNDPGVLYFHLSPEECFFAAGFYRLDPPLIGKLRDPAILTALRQRHFICARDVAAAETREPALVDAFCAFASDALPLLEWGWD